MAKAVEGPRDLIMPIREEYGEQIVHGLKRYEMRKHPCHAPIGSRFWVYAMASSRVSHTGLFLGSMIYGGSVPFDTDADLRHIAVEAAATYELLDGTYLHGRRPAYGLRVQWYQRLLEPIEKTVSGMGIRRFPDRALLRRLKAAAKTNPRRPLSRTVLEDGGPRLLKEQRLRTPSAKIVS
jgi:predicted transcriptional regulator